MTSPASRPRRRIRLPVVLFAHPFEVALGAACILVGIRALDDVTLLPRALRTETVTGVETLLSLTALVGGLLVLIGLAQRDEPRGRALERAGMYLLITTFWCYGLAVVGAYGVTIFATFLACFGLGCAFRIAAIDKTERIIRQVLATDRAAILRLYDGRPPAPIDDEERP